MHWEEKTASHQYIVPDDVQDLSFSISCSELPVDHAWQLRTQIAEIIPWIRNEPVAAIHSIHGAASGNGWTRPMLESGSMLQLSRRTRLYLRLPEYRITDAALLVGKEIDISGAGMRIKEFKCRKLVPSKTVFARSISSHNVQNEILFTQEILQSLEQVGIFPAKLLCGLAHDITCNPENLHARSVLLADLEPHESIYLQHYGLGSHGLLGCGIFLPHKSIASVTDPDLT